MTLADRIDIAAERAYGAGLARAFGGALIFAFPMLMTMEMWALGAAVAPGRLIVFLLAGLPLIYGLSFYAGFNAQRGWRHDAMNTLTALAVGVVTSASLLGVFGLLDGRVGLGEAVGMITLQAVPAAVGATLARRQLDNAEDVGDEDEASWLGEVFLMVAGAFVLAFNVAPTEEVILIAWQAAGWQLLLLALASVALLHVFVFSVGFAGQEEAGRPVAAFFRFTLVGYALALLVSLFVLWVFGRTDDQSLVGLVSIAVVLGFPAALGAAVARLVV